MYTVLLILIVLLYVLVLAFFLFMGFRFKFLVPTPIQRGHEIFEYEFNLLCTSTTLDAKQLSQNCDPHTWNGSQFTRLEWVSNPNGNHYFCHYYIQGNTFVYNKMAYLPQNYWITIYDTDKNTTVGSARYSTCWKESQKNDYSKAGVKNTMTRVSAASGLLANYEGANVFIDFTNKKRKIYLYHEDFLPPGIQGPVVKEKEED
jgi:hypothetical protein